MRKFVYVFLIPVLFACNQSGKTTTEEAVVADEDVVLTLPEFFEKIDNSVDSEIKITGLVDHVCKETGQRMFIVDGDKRLKVTTGDDISEFEIALEGKDVIVNGVVEEERIDDAYLDEWEAQLSKGEEDHDTGIHDGNHADEEDATLAKINNYREQVKNSEKGYLSIYSVKATSFEVKE